MQFAKFINVKINKQALFHAQISERNLEKQPQTKAEIRIWKIEKKPSKTFIGKESKFLPCKMFMYSLYR